MARRVFFSFHFERDIWRVNQVRNSWLTQDRNTTGFWDASLWEEAKKKGDAAIKKMIDQGLANTSVTAVLIGAETASREYVRYEILESVKRGNGILGVHINQLHDSRGHTDLKGPNPFDPFYYSDQQGRRIALSQVYPTYNWTSDDGYNNFGRWVEAAAKRANR